MVDRPYESRTVAAKVELRESSDEAPLLTGYASTFNVPYQVGYFEEVIDPDAFKRTLSNTPDVRLLVDHEGQPLARTKSGTLTLSTDTRGLKVEARLDPTDPDVMRLLPKMRRGDLDQMSFAFRVPDKGDAWDYNSATPRRTVREAILHGGDVSVVTYPANEDTPVSIRARDERDAAFTFADSILREVRSGQTFDRGNLNRFRSALDTLGVKVEQRRAVRRSLSGDESYSDREQALSDALLAKFGAAGDSDIDDLWVVDAADTWVIWRVYGSGNPGPGLWRLMYTVDGDVVTFDGDPVQVTAQTDYVPVVQANSRHDVMPLDLAQRRSEAMALRASRG